MHPGSVNNMKLIKDRYLQYLHTIDKPRVLDVGGLYHVPKKSYSQLFTDVKNIEWVVIDILKHDSVDYTLDDPFKFPFEDNTFDLVVSGQMLEHCLNPYKSVAEMKRVLKVGSRMALIAPSAGPRHDVRDGWRFLDDAFKFIAEDIGGIEIVADWIQKDAPDERSRKWQDHMFVGEKNN